MDRMCKKRVCDLDLRDLRQQLQIRGLDPSGDKNVLMDRLHVALKAEGKTPEEEYFEVSAETPKKKLDDFLDTIGINQIDAEVINDLFHAVAGYDTTDVDNVGPGVSDHDTARAEPVCKDLLEGEEDKNDGKEEKAEVHERKRDGSEFDTACEGYQKARRLKARLARKGEHNYHDKWQQNKRTFQRRYSDQHLRSRNHEEYMTLQRERENLKLERERLQQLQQAYAGKESMDVDRRNELGKDQKTRLEIEIKKEQDMLLKEYFCMLKLQKEKLHFQRIKLQREVDELKKQQLRSNDFGGECENVSSRRSNRFEGRHDNEDCSVSSGGHEHVFERSGFSSFVRDEPRVFEHPQPCDGGQGDKKVNRFSSQTPVGGSQRGPVNKVDNWGCIDGPPQERWCGMDHGRNQPPMGGIGHQANMGHPPNQMMLGSATGSIYDLINKMQSYITGEQFNMPPTMRPF